MEKTKILYIIILVMLVVILALATFSYIEFLQVSSAKSQMKVSQANTKTIIFAKLFVERILGSSGTVNFNDRLKLENAVRDINDSKIFNDWENFTNSKTDQESQQSVSQLFSDIFNKLGQ